MFSSLYLQDDFQECPGYKKGNQKPSKKSLWDDEPRGKKKKGKDYSKDRERKRSLVE